ncbi:ribonuclease H-like domain-containing protein [Mycena filopes]|nr:ribonuclease H-like domain-containing protein [Mycena filopes]
MSSGFSIKSPTSVFRALSALRSGVRVVPGDADTSQHEPYPETHQVLYITTEFRANEVLRGISDGAVGFDCEFTKRRPTLEEHYLLDVFPAGSAARKAAVLGLQVVEAKRDGRYPIAWDHIGLRLVQISRNGVAWVLDMWKIRAFPAELRNLLLNPKVKKIGVGVANDILVMWDDLRTEMTSVVDAGLMAKLLLSEQHSKTGFNNLSLQVSAAEVLGLFIKKDTGTSDWSAKKLSDEQIRYAALDAVASEALYHTLVPALEQKTVEIGSPIPKGWYTFNTRLGEPTRLKKNDDGSEMAWKASDCNWWVGARTNKSKKRNTKDIHDRA